MQNLGVGWIAKIMWAFVWDYPEDPGVWHYFDEDDDNASVHSRRRPKLYESQEEAEEWAMFQGSESKAHNASLHSPVAVIVAETDDGLVIAPLPGAFRLE